MSFPEFSSAFSFKKILKTVYLRSLQRKKGNMPQKSCQENRLGENDKNYADQMRKMTKTLQNLNGNGFAL